MKKLLIIIALLTCTTYQHTNAEIGISFGGGYPYWNRWGWNYGWGWNRWGWGPGWNWGWSAPAVVVERPVVVKRRIVQRPVQRQLVAKKTPERMVQVTVTNRSEEPITLYFDQAGEKTLDAGEKDNIRRRSCNYEVYYRESKKTRTFNDCSTSITIKNVKES